MKKRILILVLLLALVLSACGKPAVYTVEKQGMTFTLDTEKLHHHPERHHLPL